MSFRRNSKRIAGPGFHVNVRFCDMTVLKCKNNKAQTHRTLQRGLRLPEVFDVKEQELLVCLSGKNQASYFDGYTHCFSAVNNWKLSEGVDPTNDDAVKEDILSNVAFVGVANTEYVPKPGYEQQGFVAQVGGVVTLINESGSNINPGDKVMLDLNLDPSMSMKDRDKGIPREKVRFTVRKAYTSDEIINKAQIGVNVGDATSCEDDISLIDDTLKGLRKELSKAKKEGTDTSGITKKIKSLEKDKKSALSKEDPVCGSKVSGLKKFLDNYQRLSNRVIGKSYSFARSGDRLEVGLQPRNPY